MFTFLRQKKPLRFVVISASLTAVAIAAALVGAVAGRTGNYDLAAFSSRIALGLAVVIVLYMGPQLARSIQWRSDYAMQVPNAGLIFSAVILMVTILSLSSGNNLLYLVLAALLATLIVSVLSARLNLKRLKPTVHYPDHIFAGESVPFEVTLKNEKRLLPSFSLSVDLVEERQSDDPDIKSDQKSGEQRSAALAYFPVVPARAHARMRTRRNLDRRGVYKVTGFIINTGFPFGFVEQRRFIEWSGEVVVYPQSKPIDDFSHLLPMIAGRIESRAKGSGSDLYAIRPYLPSDHHHHIDWKATAKTSQLMIREFTREDDLRVTVVFDSQADQQTAAETDFAEKFERAVTFAASLVTHFTSRGAEIRLVAGSEDTGYGTGQSHQFEMLRRLAELRPLPMDENEPVARSREDSGFEIMITPNGKRGTTQSTAVTSHVVSFEDLYQYQAQEEAGFSESPVGSARVQR